MRRLSILLAAAALVVAVAAPGAAVANSRPVEYLALGDSLAFGYNPNESPYDTAKFSGYPDPTNDMLGDTVTNLSCPGETSSHFIDLAGADHGCGFWRFTAQAPLQYEYSGTQLAAADAFLKAHPKTQLITIDMGANDIGALRDSCTASYPTNPVPCFMDGLPATLATLSANLDTIYSHIRVTDGYTHKLVALTVYSNNYADPLTTGAIMQVNQVVTDRTLAWNGIVADGFGAFAAATAPFGGDTCAAGLLLPSTTGTGCDDHPSVAGRDLLAETTVKVLRAD